jgi:hypothetical protein
MKSPGCRRGSRAFSLPSPLPNACQRSRSHADSTSNATAEGMRSIRHVTGTLSPGHAAAAVASVRSFVLETPLGGREAISGAGHADRRELLCASRVIGGAIRCALSRLSIAETDLSRARGAPPAHGSRHWWSRGVIHLRRWRFRLSGPAARLHAAKNLGATATRLPWSERAMASHQVRRQR